MLSSQTRGHTCWCTRGQALRSPARVLQTQSAARCRGTSPQIVCASRPEPPWCTSIPAWKRAAGGLAAAVLGASLLAGGDSRLLHPALSVIPTDRDGLSAQYLQEPLSGHSCFAGVSARLEGVNKPELLPKEFTTVIDVAGFLTPGEVGCTFSFTSDCMANASSQFQEMLYLKQVSEMIVRCTSKSPQDCSEAFG